MDTEAESPEVIPSNEDATYLPPTSASCEGGKGATGSPTKAADFPALLLLPDGAATTTELSDDVMDCAGPHTALFAENVHERIISTSLLVEGPDAPSASQLGYDQPDCGCRPGHPTVRGVTGTLSAKPGFDQVWWTEADGGQWHAQVSLTPGSDSVTAETLAQSTVAELDRATITGNTMTLADSDAPAAAGWLQLHPAGNRPAERIDVFTTWNIGATQVTLQVEPAAVPESGSALSARLDGRAGYADERQLVSVNGHGGIFEAGGSTGPSSLKWQQGDVTLFLKADLGEAQLQRIAASLQLASPGDPRLAHS